MREFKVDRRIVAVNLFPDKLLFDVKGKCSIKADTAPEVGGSCTTGPDATRRASMAKPSRPSRPRLSSCRPSKVDLYRYWIILTRKRIAPRASALAAYLPPSCLIVVAARMGAQRSRSRFAPVQPAGPGLPMDRSQSCWSSGFVVTPWVPDRLRPVVLVGGVGSGARVADRLVPIELVFGILRRAWIAHRAGRVRLVP